MAKNRNDFFKIIGELDMVFASTAVNGPLASARRIVSELQEEGPSWTGEFSNSWKVETLDGRSYSGDGQPGEPRPVKIPLLTGRQATKSVANKDKVVYTISNFSRHALEASDLVESDFSAALASAPTPQTQLGRSKWERSGKTRPDGNHKRYEINGPKSGSASRTAKPNWFTSYVNAGRLDAAVQVEMDKIYRAL